MIVIPGERSEGRESRPLVILGSIEDPECDPVIPSEAVESLKVNCYLEAISPSVEMTEGHDIIKIDMKKERMLSSLLR